MLENVSTAGRGKWSVLSLQYNVNSASAGRTDKRVSLNGQQMGAEAHGWMCGMSRRTSRRWERQTRLTPWHRNLIAEFLPRYH
ncbi:hypothetical protein CY34DRAFT_811591 [Suillus luteus UH-Slu-Lm8-n1]|uniref:Uncharacterized protein n=1 Tax=Suillus luteus UH-Slu-Lm8-n1 TaxID=930992 RepID=A0A0D0AD85_9AGAM|nr:hypothetical protein CY34DRAFT_811591 [Suillus luteus UH-Slu-Lm8-n1]